MSASESSVSFRLKLLSGFGAIYFIWGSTFLAIRYAIDDIPPFLMAGARFLAAGLILCLWRGLVHRERPRAVHWRGALLVGGLLFLGGNGAVVWSEQHVPSGLTALLLAAIPLWMVLLDSLRGSGSPLNGRVLSGLALGMAGLALLLGPSQLLGGGRVNLAGAGVLMMGSLCWAAGSLISREVKQPSSLPLAAGMQMLTGGALLTVAGIVSGEPDHFSWAGLSMRAAMSLLYLILFGSVVAFTAYSWLLAVTTPARVSTYAYVNPIVAVLLGWALAAEPVTPRTLVATTVIVAGVAIIITARTQHMPPLRERSPQPEVAA